MNKLDIFKQNIKKANFTASEAHEWGIGQRMLSYHLKKRAIERIGKGLYRFIDREDSEEDFLYSDLVIASAQMKDSVICLISALSYWNITDEIPKKFWIALPNNHPLPKDQKKIKVIRPRDLVTGVMKISISGFDLKITTPERSICDAFKYLDEESAITSLRHYLSREDDRVDIRILLDTAEKLRSKRVIEIVREIAVARSKDYPTLKPKALLESNRWLSEHRKEVK